MKNHIYDLIIIGGGPAGMAAGIYGARENLDMLLITKSFGGQITRKSVEIENYPGFKKISGQKLIQRLESHFKRYKVPVVMEKVTDVKKKGNVFKVCTEKKKEFQTLSVLVASGADPRPLEVPGEKEFIGKGVSYCVTCDGPLYRNKNVAVIGGGNAGFEAALFLSKIADKVYILEFGSKIKADKINQDRIKKTNNVEVITKAGLKEIKGTRFVESIVYQEVDTKKEKEVKAEGVFVQIGSVPATDFVKDLVDFTKIDEIVVDSKTGETKLAGLFAAGDITNEEYKQIVIAVGQGTKAVLSISRYIDKLKNN